MAYEINFDGLIGPSHNYGGMSEGNLASQRNAELVAHPREAALQGLEKMRLMVRGGLIQGFLPPLLRPNLMFLKQAGFTGDVSEMIRTVVDEQPHLLRVIFSASAMWAANAATVSPSADTRDGRIHLTTANLSTMLHRSLEHPDTFANLKKIFLNPAFFQVHEALPQHAYYSDEGAANHIRLCAEHGAPGVEVFVYGREAEESMHGFPARQSRKASESIARSHGLAKARSVFARQSRAAIEAGAFHNDVVGVGSLNTLFTHELAFEDKDAVYRETHNASDGLFDFQIVEVAEAEVPLRDAISSYLFNSQLVKFPDEERLVLIAPLETKETQSTKAYCDALVKGNGPIGRVEYVDVRQSMRNGGGPACLRLRVVVTEAELAAVNPAYLLDERKIDALQAWVKDHYRETLHPQELGNPALVGELQNAHMALTALINQFSADR